MCTVAESTAWSTVSFWSGGQARFRRGTPESGGSAFEENLSHAAPSLLLVARQPRGQASCLGPRAHDSAVPFGRPSPNQHGQARRDSGAPLVAAARKVRLSGTEDRLQKKSKQQ